MKLLGDEGQGESCFGSFGDSVSFCERKVHGLDKCTIVSGIILHKTDRTPR
jgi:hypothetical protein